MPDWSESRTPGYCRELNRRRQAYRRQLIAKGVPDGGSKMLKLMSRKRFWRTRRMKKVWDHLTVGVYYFVFFIIGMPIWLIIIMPEDTDDEFFEALIPGFAFWVFGLCGLIYYLI